MNSVINRMYEMFVRVDAFATERAEAFPAGTLGAEMVAELKSVIQTLTGATTTQTSGLSSVQRATAERMAASETLRDTMQALVRTARVMAIDTPGLENKFRLPRNASVSALLQTARAFVADAIPLKAEFIRHGMHESFIEDFREEIADLERAIGEQNTGRGTHVSATVTVESAAERGMNAVRKLDAFIRNRFREDASMLAAWASARHLERATHARKRPNGDPGVNKPDGGGNV